MNSLRLFVTVVMVSIFCGAAINAADTAVVTSTAPVFDTRTNKQKLADPNPTVRRNAALHMGRERNKANVPALIKLIDDESVEVRRAAINALSATGDTRVIAPFITRFGKEENMSVKMNIIVALGDIKSVTALSFLTSVLKDPYPVFRSEAVRALGKINAPSSHGAIVAMLADEAEGVRVMAAQVAGNHKLTAAVPLLEKNLADPVMIVRRTCAQALGRTGGEASVAALERLLKDKESTVVSAAQASIDMIRKRAGEREKAVVTTPPVEKPAQ